MEVGPVVMKKDDIWANLDNPPAAGKIALLATDPPQDRTKPIRQLDVQHLEIKSVFLDPPLHWIVKTQWFHCAIAASAKKNFNVEIRITDDPITDQTRITRRPGQPQHCESPERGQHGQRAPPDDPSFY